MDYIILDIEFNGRKFASDLPMEVIEIGAVRLDEALQYKDEFTSLVKPVYFSKLNSFIKEKTGIPQEGIDAAPGFPAAAARFREWLGRSEEFIFVTWGGEDMKRIVLDARMHKLDDAYWTAIPYFDLLKGYIRYKNVTNDVSVEAALAELGIQNEGSAHRALDDARMTGDIFRAVFAHLDFERIQYYKDVYSNAKERRMVKNAVRTMAIQKQPQTWDVLVEKFLKDKVNLDDPRKAAELEAYFAAEVAARAQKPRKAPAAAQKTAESASSAAAATSATSATSAETTTESREARR
ncbi:exonuclease domain-containing protein [Paenibacillus antri]|uniref:Exonuclease domain-containing protein n=1 Tax=Paenibacillus antri TaxID=2582848 RepID=A0A5R9GA10_9BACL|nr:3'-5' exonuclease [Paenibacillus antri]TLS51196.1 exonuclease domain-containing protein [Paenibacillus antri]